VELKKSTGSVVSGYNSQLQIYKDASRTNFGIFVVLDYGDLAGKLKKIQDIKRSREQNGLPVSEIVVVDATKKASASKR
jgi:hypothetical protein